LVDAIALPTPAAPPMPAAHRRLPTAAGGAGGGASGRGEDGEGLIAWSPTYRPVRGLLYVRLLSLDLSPAAAAAAASPSGPSSGKGGDKSKGTFASLLPGGAGGAGKAELSRSTRSACV
jgi:hypothetical protein